MAAKKHTIPPFCPICGQRVRDARCPKDKVAPVVVRSSDKPAALFEGGDLVTDRYELGKRLGGGTYGTVFAARNLATGHELALKLFSMGSEGSPDHLVRMVRRFYREARVTAGLRSRYTLRVFDVGKAPGGPFFLAMERLRGPALWRLLRDDKKRPVALPVPIAIRFARQVLESLAEAHAADLVHRDLKPANIIVFQDGDGKPSVKVLDFGIARVKDSSLTGRHEVLGTPAYMSPEQCNAGVLDARSDLYSLGVILFEMLTGRPPFSGDKHVAVMVSHMQKPVPDPRLLAPQPLDDALVDCLMRALEKDPAARFGDARAMARALDDVTAHLRVAALAPSEPPPLPQAELETPVNDSPAKLSPPPLPAAADDIAADDGAPDTAPAISARGQDADRSREHDVHRSQEDDVHDNRDLPPTVEFRIRPLKLREMPGQSETGSYLLGAEDVVEIVADLEPTLVFSHSPLPGASRTLLDVPDSPTVALSVPPRRSSPVRARINRHRGLIATVLVLIVIALAAALLSTGGSTSRDAARNLLEQAIIESRSNRQRELLDEAARLDPSNVAVQVLRKKLASDLPHKPHPNAPE